MYEKQTWNTGDIITAEKLNHMEDGIGGGLLIVHADENNVLDKTWKEMNEADFVVLAEQLGDVGRGFTLCNVIVSENGEYGVSFSPIGGNEMYFFTDNENGYPIMPGEVF